MSVRRHRFLGAALVLLSLALAVGCKNDSPSATGTPSPAIAADFALVDVNTNSPSYGDTISPRDYLQQVSAWYFGHST